MKLFYDLLPIVAFFLTYKLYGLYVATGTAMATVGAQVATTLIRKQKPDLMQWITFGIMLVLGSSTLLLQNEIFIKWKPTAVYWLLSILFAGSPWVAKKNLVQKMLENSLSLPAATWNTLNRSWASFFFIMGTLNLIVVYSFDTDTWVNFKLFGTLVLTLLFMVFQVFLIYKHLPKNNG